jgi:RND family efflux transporter MFP subunit
MNVIPGNDRKLAEALRSLSLEPSLQTPKSPTRARRLLLSGCFLAVAAGAVFTLSDFWPEAANFLVSLPQQWQSEDVSTVPDVKKRSGSGAEQATALDVASAVSQKPSALVREITGSGYVVAPHVVAVFSKYEGRITSIDVDVGQRVEVGQAIVTLDDASTRFALDEAKAEKVSAGLVLEAKDIELDQARVLFRRAEALAAKQSISKQDEEKAGTARDSALNALAQARQDLVKADIKVQIAQERVDALVVRAPIAGTITQLDAHVGDMVLARIDSVREHQKLLSITDTTTLVIDADVAETNIGGLRLGLPGEAVLDGIPDRPFAIEVLKIAPVASVEKGTVTLRLALRDPPDGIRPNMAARIRISQQVGDTSQ